MPNLTQPCAGQRSVCAGSRILPGEWGVVMPVKMRMAISETVEKTPTADE